MMALSDASEDSFLGEGYNYLYLFVCHLSVCHLCVDVLEKILAPL